MGKCEMCEIEIDDKYKFCLKCSQKLKDTNKEVGAVKDTKNEGIIKELGAINNNLYAIRTILEAELEKKYKLSLKWEKKDKENEGRFIIEKKAKK